jgi:hypothetical protein
MSVSKPQNRAEFKKHILTKLGAPVLEINVADEQMDVAIDDAFQYFNERNHFNGVERVYLSTKITQEFLDNWTSFEVDYVKQEASGQSCAQGMVEELTLAEPGTGYPPSDELIDAGVSNQQPNIASDPDKGDLLNGPEGLPIITGSTSSGSGRGLSLIVYPERTTTCGLVRVAPHYTGTGYQVGDYVTVKGGNNNAIFQVTKVKTSSPTWGSHPIKQQRNFLVLPDDVVGVTKVLTGSSGAGLGGGIIPPGSIFPIMMGGMGGDSCNNTGFGLSHYWIMQGYLALINFMFNPPRMYNFNQRTHHLHIDGKLGSVGEMLVLECMVKPSPDVYPDLWNDLWLKEFAYALVKAQWGRNLTKYQQVQLPGGIVINGERILQDAQQELKEIKDRFSMDWMDPPLDEVG